MSDDYLDEVMSRFEKDVIWLRNHLPPDDVYQFCQQCLLGAVFLVDKWKSGKDFQELANKDPLTRVWLQNIYGILALQNTDIDGIVNVDMKTWGFDNDNQD